MKIKLILTALCMSFVVSACSTVEKVVYRIDVPQGNYLEKSTVDKLQVGMTREQVKYLLGTPVLQDPFSTQTWYYVYLQQKAYEAPQQHTLTVNFNQAGNVTDFNLDKPLPETKREVVNNAIIEATPQESGSWWQFWK
ncbi:outer membrane protein assembly factor BamE [Bisgaard Taxon 10/6]|uniref:Outer membrane protein assembly factor BamE n=2 Tax=Exercitatus varius TaxID=67857 RepID=A0AAW6Q8W0_9PAST|nr:outer membrane protein assembly factor BamE [Exercitatus varius]QOF67031.1 outer membrane protein assembly factor BamE [Actinobacillus sp. GY-402]MDG2917659.1 outer membrane protein assembly factor BamE [Exercitatus varius]MDG2939913.1 outer membrane protein assembly factor BamE [Exercitatus varius]MDG2943128.1 outer membrane protein assembly factor BamE [Exercitatus varius]MDG2945416.1 outer membrane protein assembly factor BamE [Exercitatus varius]